MLSAMKLKLNFKDMENIKYNEGGTNFTQNKGFTVIIETSNAAHCQVVIHNAILRKTLGATNDAFELQVNGKFLTIRGRLIKGDDVKSFHIQGDENKSIIKAVLGL